MSEQQAPVDRTVALTGGTGFIGATVLRHLLAGQWRVRSLYRPRDGRVLPQLPGVTWVAGDVRDEAALARLVEGVQAVVHCAGVVRGARRADFDLVNVDGVERLAAAAAAENPAPRFLLVSSLAARCHGLSDYAASKWCGERALEVHGGRLRWTAFRPPAVYGPGDREMLPVFRAIARGVAPIPAGGGRFSMLHVDDLASAVLCWLSADVGYGEIFELDDGTDGGYDWDSLLRIAGGILRRGGKVHRVVLPPWSLGFIARVNLAAARVLRYAPMLTPGKLRELAHPDWVADSEPFVRATGWRPAFPFAQGLAQTFGLDPSVQEY